MTRIPGNYHKKACDQMINILIGARRVSVDCNYAIKAQLLHREVN